MVYGKGPKGVAAEAEAIKSNIPNGWTIDRFADGFSVWSRSPERMVGNMKRRADGWIAYSYVTDRAEWFRHIADAALWVSEQHGEWMANVSHRMAEGFTWSIRQCLPPPLDVDPLTPRRSDWTFRPPLEWGIRAAGLNQRSKPRRSRSCSTRSLPLHWKCETLWSKPPKLPTTRLASGRRTSGIAARHCSPGCRHAVKCR